ncbi:MAG: type I methionyl aminopeptidase [Alphaproteobacteria bacterium]|nr:type I methionyl aminopeptidase [Alphaproteobacteria bacterium]
MTHSPLKMMRRAGRAAAATRDAACALVKPGVTTQAIDDLVRADTHSRGGRCAQHGYRVGGVPFPANVCTSVNTVVCHGVPSSDVVLEDGDIVNIDVTTELGGWHGDTSRTVCVGTPSPEALHLVEATRRALTLGIAQVRPGVPLSRIGEVIEVFARSQGCTVVRAFGGHGIGRRMHQAPHVHHHATGRPWPVLQPGMFFTIEPMLCLGRSEVQVLDDGWTVVTADGSLSAQFEHTVAVTRDGVEVMTLPVF